jgi:hypothetical protein
MYFIILNTEIAWSSRFHRMLFFDIFPLFSRVRTCKAATNGFDAGLDSLDRHWSTLLERSFSNRRRNVPMSLPLRLSSLFLMSTHMTRAAVENVISSSGLSLLHGLVSLSVMALTMLFGRMSVQPRM